MSNWNSLEDLFPPLTEQVMSEISDDVSLYLYESGNKKVTRDDFVFLATIEYYMRTLEKAKSMIIKDKFTTSYTGNKQSVRYYLDEFQIIPVTKKE